MKNTLVSVCCLSYNHEKYIEKCIKSIVNQQTNFEFEVLVNDDCSTDGTIEILKRLQNTYSEVVKPLYHKENQYSKKKSGQRMNPTFNFPRAKGKYIAICECDDYWLDNKKLQIQVDLMEKNDKINYVFSDYIVDTGGDLLEKSKLSDKDIPSLLDLHQILKINLMPASLTIIFRKNKLPKTYPEWFMNCFNGDWGMLFIIASEGEVGYINKPLAVYRRGIGIISKTNEFFKFKNGLETNKAINKYTNYKYNYHIGKQEWHLENITYALMEENKLFQGIIYLIQKLCRSLLENKFNSMLIRKNIMFLKHCLKIFFLKN